LEECPQLDVVVKGEGEQTIAELASGENLPTIKGTAFWENGKARESEKRGLVKNLDEIPFPAYHLLPMEKYEMGGTKFAAILTSRCAVAPPELPVHPLPDGPSRLSHLRDSPSPLFRHRKIS